MKEPLEYVYYRQMSSSQWLEYNSRTYSTTNWKKWEEENDIPFEDIGKSFEPPAYEIVASDINPNSNYDKLIRENEKIDYVEGIDEYLAKLSKDVYF